MGHETYHEPLELLSEASKDMHRAIVSLIEELEAIDWYGQRAEATADATLREVLLHHREEEVEHAMMNLEWIRRRSSEFDQKIRTYLHTAAPITPNDAEEEKAARGGGAPPGAPGAPTPASLGIGSLRAR